MFNLFNFCHFCQDDDKLTHFVPKRPLLHHSKQNQLVYQNLSVVKKLAASRFPVYLALSEANNQHYAMKVFPHVNGHPNHHFTNEARFAFLKHPNVIKIFRCELQREAIHKEETNNVSYIVMEYAPYGDFLSFELKFRFKIDEKLARTYFRQLIDGIEYLHENGVAHLDLKPENLMIGQDFNLRIVDFDLSYIEGDHKVLSHGTMNYRAPELVKTPAISPEIYAADIYSAGIILFLLKTGGVFPHAEDDGPDYGNLKNLMYQDNSKFWKKHCELERKEDRFFDSDFKKLFNGMVKEKPSQRMSIKQIRKSKWYNGPVYSYVEMCKKMKGFLVPSGGSGAKKKEIEESL